MVFSLRCQKKQNKKTPVTFKYELCRSAAQSKFHKDKISLKVLLWDSSPISQRTNFLLGPKSVQDITCSAATTHSTFLLWLMLRMHLKPTRKRAHCGSINLFTDSWKKHLNLVTSFSVFVKLQAFISVFCVEEVWQFQIKVNTAVRRAFLLYYKEKKPLCGQKIQDWSFSLPMKRCCSNSQSELSQFTSWSPITFTWVWMSLAAENLAL